MRVCTLIAAGVLVNSTINPKYLKVDLKGMIESFTLSVNNATVWKKVIETSTKTCYDEYTKPKKVLVCKGTT